MQEGIPVFSEVEEDLIMSPSDLEKILNQHKDISAVLPVHVFGLPCRVKEIQQIIDQASRKSAPSVFFMMQHMPLGRSEMVSRWRILAMPRFEMGLTLSLQAMGLKLHEWRICPEILG